MRKVKMEVPFIQYYLPTTRHRKERKMMRSGEHDFQIREPEHFPIAFRITDHKNVWNEAEETTVYQVFTRDIRVDEGDHSLWKLSEDRQTGKPVSSEELEDELTFRMRQCQPRIFSEDVSDEVKKTVLYTKDTFLEQVALFQKQIDEDIRIFDGYVWEPAGEPIYKVQTFGLGNNHGGTGFFIDEKFERYKDDTVLEDYEFPSNMREEAIAYFEDTASSRGDTNSLRDDYSNINIEVVMPECIDTEKLETFMVEVQATYLVPMKADSLETAKCKVTDELGWLDLNRYPVKLKEESLEVL